MSSLIDLFKIKSDKFQTTKLTGSGNYFKTIEEINQYNLSQEKFITNVDYSNPANFAKFGSAQEYYKTAINYINSSYPYDASTEEKIKWENNLSNLEYFLFKDTKKIQESNKVTSSLAHMKMPRTVGHIKLVDSQKLYAYSHVKDLSQFSTQDIYKNLNYTTNTELSLDKGFTFETWIKFGSIGGFTEVFKINYLTSSGGNLVTNNLLNLKIDYNNVFVQVGTNSTIFTISEMNEILDYNKWYHIALSISNITENNGNYYYNLAYYINGKRIIHFVRPFSSTDPKEFVFTKTGLFAKPLSAINLSSAPSNQIVYTISGNAAGVSYDETRLWNGKRSSEEIGRNWFTTVDGNNFSTLDVYDLLFYYKYNEGWNLNNGYVCVDYSGRKNDAVIEDYETSCRVGVSAIDESEQTNNFEEREVIVGGMSYSDVVKDYYEEKIAYAKKYDEQNRHLLYNKFPDWMKEEEENQEIKHLFEICQIISYYFDDLYLKMKEVVNYKSIKFEDKPLDRIYPFYDRILNSFGFETSELFNNLSTREKIESRGDINLFEQDVNRVKNKIFQNIYNNLSYIYKSKGTEKSLKTFFSTYGVSEDLLKINLYADGADYYVQERTKKKPVKKKVVKMLNGNSVYSSNYFLEKQDVYQYSLETCFNFPASLKSNSPTTGSIFGLQTTDTYDLKQWYPNNTKHYFVLFEGNENLGHRFILSGSSGMASSSYFTEIFDNTNWNLCLRKNYTVDTLIGANLNSLSYNIELYGVNKNRYPEVQFSCSLPYDPYISGIYENRYLRHYIGARKENLNGNVLHSTNLKFLYSNFWTDYLTDDEIISHNKDILNYGSNQ